MDSDCHQRHLFQLLRVLELLHRVDVQLRKQFLVLLLACVEFDPFVLQVRTLFNGVSIIKPDASRSRSREVYLVAKGLKAN